MRKYLFVYGTLLPGFAPAAVEPLVRRLRLVGRGSVQGSLYDLGNYPGAVLDKAAARVWGQVFELPADPSVLRHLDHYEGFDPKHPDSSEFVRKKCTVSLENGRRIKCWIYGYSRPAGTAARIVDGDFSKHKSR